MYWGALKRCISEYEYNNNLKTYNYNSNSSLPLVNLKLNLYNCFMIDTSYILGYCNSAPHSFAHYLLTWILRSHQSVGLQTGLEVSQIPTHLTLHYI